MGNTLAQDCFAMPEPFLGPYQLRLKLLEISSTKVLEFAPLAQIPHALLWIEVGCRTRQSLQMDAFGSPLRQKLLDRLTAVNKSPHPR